MDAYIVEPPKIDKPMEIPYRATKVDKERSKLFILFGLKCHIITVFK